MNYRLNTENTDKKFLHKALSYTLVGLAIVELKALPYNSQNHEIQLSEYTKVTPYEVAYLFNFGMSQLYFKRIIFTNDRKHFLSLPK